MRGMITWFMAALVCALPGGTAAHDIPNDVRVQAFVKPSGQRLQLLVRVPLMAMREVDCPRRGPGYLDLARADAALRNAATLWISDNIELYEGEVRLGNPRLVEVRVSLPSDKSFGSYEDALAHVTGPPLPSNLELYWNQGLLDVLFEYPIQSDGSDFSIHSGLARLADGGADTCRPRVAGECSAAAADRAAATFATGSIARLDFFGSKDNDVAKRTLFASANQKCI